MKKNKKIREFKSGATRDTNIGKLEYSRFLSPEVLYYFANYMHENRKQKDGKLREPDNWKKGMDLEVYMSSLSRHYWDIWLHHESYKRYNKPSKLATETLEDSLCGALFNSMGYLYELKKDA